MILRQRTTREERLICLLGASLCGILLFFAVTTKLAGYHPQDLSAKPIASTRIWQEVGKAPVAFEQVRPTSAVFALIAFVASLVLALTWSFPTDEPAGAFQSWLSPDLSIRPPPAL